MSNIIFNKLMNINLLHEYYANGICTDLQIKASSETQVLIRQYGLLFKPTNLGAIMLYESIDDLGTPKISIDEPLKLTFLLSANSSFFTNFTEADFSTIPATVYHFSNKNSGVIESGNDFTITQGKLNKPLPLITKFLKVNKSGSANYVLLLDTENKATKIFFDPDEDVLTIDMAKFESGTYEFKQFTAADTEIGSSSTMYYNKSLSGTIPFAVFEIFLDENSMDALPINFIFNLKSRETFWRYKVLVKESVPPTSDYTIDSSNVSIIHTPHEGDPISFEAASDSEPIIIRSTDKVKLKEKGVDQIGLYRGEDNILISSLPNPSPLKLEKVGNDWYSDIYVYVYV